MKPSKNNRTVKLWKQRTIKQKFNELELWNHRRTMEPWKFHRTMDLSNKEPWNH